MRVNIALTGLVVFGAIAFAGTAAVPRADIHPAQQLVPEQPGVPGVRVRECKLAECLVVSAEDLGDLLKANKTLAEERDAARRERDMLRTSKGCGRLTVPPGGRGA
jgi:hypothetical protein